MLDNVAELLRGYNIRNKKLDVIIDIETVIVLAKNNDREAFSNAIFNVGITIQHKGGVIYAQNICIRDIWLQPEHRIIDFYRKNFTEEDFDIHFFGFDDFYRELFIPMLKEIKKQSAKCRLWSFNASFDRRGFIDNLTKYDIYMPEAINNNWKCIMVLASNIIAMSPRKYYNFLIEQEYLTKKGEFITIKGNYKTSAEAMYRFISKNIDFIEAHKGKEDSLIEGEILEWCKKKSGWTSICCNPIGGAWTIANPNSQPFQAMSSILVDQQIAEGNGQLYPPYLTVRNMEAFDYLIDRAEKVKEQTSHR